MKQIQRIDFYREIRKSLNRFLSILFIVTLGVAFFTGVRSSEPDMRLSADAYLDANRFFDIRVLGTLGVTKDDLAAITKADGVINAEGAYQTEAMTKVNNYEAVLTIYSLTETMNDVTLEEGRLPQDSSECFLDSAFYREGDYQLGDTITLSSGKTKTEGIRSGSADSGAFDSESSDYVNADAKNGMSDTLITDTYTIVGYGSYAGYLTWDRGTASIGNGSADAFMFLLPESFVQEAYSVIYVTVEGAQEEICYSDAYSDKVNEVMDRIEELSGSLCTLRYQELYEEGMASISDAEEELKKQQEELDSAKEKLKEAAEDLQKSQDQIDASFSSVNEQEQELQDQENTVEASYQAGLIDEVTYQTGMQQIAAGKEQIASVKEDLTAAQEELTQGLKEYQANADEFEKQSQEAQPKLDAAQEDINEAKSEISSLEIPSWYVLDRNSLQTYVEYGQDAERIGAIGKVFPIIFFLVAALVSLTTMTRMVEEQRVQIGTMKALGYKKGSIAAKYILYAFSASMAGGILGALLGKSVLPYVIIKAYAILYINIKEIETPLNWSISIAAILIAEFCVVAATFAACYGELASSPAKLMRPPAPPSGKRVLLERITPLWKRLNFTRKATIRNLFRYKKRFFMTVFGIGSCMALLLVGFGLRDSIKEIVNKQYRTIWTYDMYLSVEEKSMELTDMLDSNNDIDEYMYARITSMDASANDVTKSINLFVPETLQSFDDFVILKDRTSEDTYTMSEDGVIITEKLAKMLSLKAGDTITIKPSETEEIEVKVSAITENYLFHYIYMSTAYYEEVFHEEPVYNRINVKTGSLSSAEKETLGEMFLADAQVQSVIFVADMEKQISNMMDSLDMVVWVLIISAGLLAFIVLYNLNNINILERKRELATLKVLGFYDGEVAEYIFRENTFLTIFGIIAGIGLGVILHQFVIRTSEIDMIMFGRQIKTASYLFSVVITLFFSTFVNWVMYFRLKKIDMIESLKSVE